MEAHSLAGPYWHSPAAVRNFQVEDIVVHPAAVQIATVLAVRFGTVLYSGIVPNTDWARLAVHFALAALPTVRQQSAAVNSIAPAGFLA